ncbi:hypothetical protein [Dyadobacter frigoris]|uniref:Uncharacterized protein n=1 Tax=Dyadobacter frigoris TaxID=2576211 RepID=A0A4V6BJU1_9BACT|nr:hypothetical protein [Dyadobacter frigoris]TKT93513.1 hypothetical protein FDK13_06625 [Dyadobacter frigoris]GLU55755.1 hypothetical protein Dfri01_52160 [Dyadobacter frigoris]
MNAIDYLREEIKSYFPESSELQLSGDFAQHRRFNFYFKIKDDYSYLLYLNWDGEYDQFILKCLEFVNEEILEKLIAAYPETGAKTFNLGQPCLTVSFIYRGENKLSVLDFKGPVDAEIHSREISGIKLMQCVDPELHKD